MKATVEITFTDGSKAKFTDGDFWAHQFKVDLEDRNTKFMAIGQDYINKEHIKFVRIEKENEQ